MAKLLKNNILTILSVAAGVSKKNVSGDTIVCTPAQAAVIIAHVRLSTLFYDTMLSFITAYCLTNNRTVIVYNFLSKSCGRFTVLIVTDGTDSVDSVQNLYSNSLWYERETHEMFGVRFDNTADSRNLLLQYGVSDTPLKKTVVSANGLGFVTENGSIKLKKNVA